MNTNITLKAIAIDTANNASDILVKNYVISLDILPKIHYLAGGYSGVGVNMWIVPLFYNGTEILLAAYNDPNFPFDIFADRNHSGSPHNINTTYVASYVFSCPALFYISATYQSDILTLSVYNRGTTNLVQQADYTLGTLVFI